ncbi:hypothetical protein [Nocardia sp. CA-120079]|uniref:hypothetical protein n=1 Tax=Nocardia sp. CA-120079 TaxID=3239974 RepID=UPI003D9892A4
MSESRGVWELRVGIFATRQQAEEVMARITMLLCPDPEHAPPCPIPWSTGGIINVSESDDPTSYRELVAQAEIEKHLCPGDTSRT